MSEESVAVSDLTTVLVTGGAGYIGSHTVLALLGSGYRVIVVDNLSTGQKQSISKDAQLVVGDVADMELINSVIREFQVEAVIHFAGSIIVPESITRPMYYYQNNTSTSRNLIECCVNNKVTKFIFSSSAAVYGAQDKMPIPETAPTLPVNPYGSSKLMTEWMLRDAAAAHDFRYVALRYFNVAGADPLGRTGQSTPDATHLIKVASQVVTGVRDFIEVYGRDYDTPDGTCIRDYIHVSDLADAHTKALSHLVEGKSSLVLNCGYGRGYSVQEVLSAVEQVADKHIETRDAPRRAGDPVELVADVSQIKSQLDWTPQHDDLNFIVQTALEWERKLMSLDPK